MKWSEFTVLHKSDRDVLLILLTAGILIVALVFFVGGRELPEASVLPMSEVDSIRMSRDSAAAAPYYAVPEQSPERFAFDPNTADSTQLLRLGLQPWQVRNIYKYRAAGGIYRRKEDFAKLYGLTVKQYHELEPYINISSDYLPASTLVDDEPLPQRDTLRFPVKIEAGEHVILNLADTAELRHVPGIGVYYAKEIARYGQLLGGYVSVDQLDEIDNFPQEAKKYFVIEGAQPQRLNINRLTLNELKRHPYINYYQAKAIVDHRRNFGPISDLDELKLLDDFTPEAIERMRPYIEY